MALHRIDPFKDIPTTFNLDTNHFVAEMMAAQEDGALPLCFGSRLREFSKDPAAFFAGKAEGFTPKKIIVEIGMHKGKCLVELAQDHPEVAYIGLDITYQRVVRTARKAQQLGLRNILAVLCDARYLADIFSQHQVGGFVVFFPDPWIKKQRQANRRLLSAGFLAQAVRLLEDGGFFWLKTDARDYFEEVERCLLALGLGPATNTAILPSSQLVSVYENKFTQNKIPTYEGFWTLSRTNGRTCQFSS